VNAGISKVSTPDNPTGKITGSFGTKGIFNVPGLPTYNFFGNKIDAKYKADYTSKFTSQGIYDQIR